MNRTILFRGKRLDNGEWVIGANYLNAEHIKTKSDVVFIASTGSKCTGDLDDCGNISNIFNCSYFAVDPLTVGQFTGLCDKNGKKIFEGDRLNRKDKQATVVFDDSEFSLEIDGNKYIQHGLLVDMWKDDLEVIGTIYDK